MPRHVVIRFTGCYASLLLSFVLAACGGKAPDSSAFSTTDKTLPVVITIGDTYDPVVQQLYVAYFGRPADPGGLANFKSLLAAAGGPPDIQAMNAAYNNNTAIRALIDSFGTSAESNTLYGDGDTSTFVTAIYNNVLNRSPDGQGLRFWVDAIDTGSLTRAAASFSIMAGALANTTPQGLEDATLIVNKIRVAHNFTTTLTDPSLYNGNGAATIARTMLSTVTADTDPNFLTATVNATYTKLERQRAPVRPFAATVTTAPQDGSTISGTITIMVEGSGIQNLELVAAGGYTPIYARGTVSGNNTTGIIQLDTRTLPDGPVSVRAIAFSVPPGQAGIEIIAMPIRTWTVRNAATPAFSARLVTSSAPYSGTGSSPEIPFVVAGVGLGNVELVSADNPSIIYGRFTISQDRTVATLNFNPHRGPAYGSFRFRVLAWDVPAGQGGRMIEVMPPRTYYVRLPLGCYAYNPGCGSPAP